MSSEIQDMKTRLVEAKRRRKHQESEAKRRERSEIYGGIVKRKLADYEDERRERRSGAVKSLMFKSAAASALLVLLVGSAMFLHYVVSHSSTNLEPEKSPFQPLSPHDPSYAEINNFLYGFFKSPVPRLSAMPKSNAEKGEAGENGMESPERLLEFLHGHNFDIISAYAGNDGASYFAYCRFQNLGNCSVGIKKGETGYVLVSAEWL